MGWNLGEYEQCDPVFLENLHSLLIAQNDTKKDG